jgi:hypothetical protein
MAKVDKYSIYGLKRRPTYEEIIGVIDESNEKITGKLPDRSATMFRNSQEGSYFDGSNAMEQLKEEQGRLLLRQMSELLLRQNVRTAGRTYHTERMQRLPTTSSTIAQPTQPMNIDEELTTQTTPTVPSSNTHQASQLNAELTQRANTTMKRREETAINHRGEVFKQNKPTIPEQIHHINPPRSFAPIKPEMYSMATDEEMPQAKAKPKAKPSASSSSSQALPVVEVMDTSSTNKRGANPETTIEPRGKAGRPKSFKAGTERMNAEKRDGSSPEEEPKMRKKRNKKKTELEIGGAEADDEIDEPKDSGKRKTIQKPVGASTIGVQRLREEFVNAKNKDMITKEQYEQFDSAYKTWFASKGNDAKKKQMLKQMREVYKLHLWQKLKDMYKAQ